jgi:integrase
VGTPWDGPLYASAALKAVEGLRLDINLEVVSIAVLTVDQVIAHTESTRCQKRIRRRLEPKTFISINLKRLFRLGQVEGPPKTLASRRPIQMSSDLASALRKWKQEAVYPNLSDWVFASPLALGKKPYWPDAVMKRHVLPAAARAGITKRTGWHSFRRTLATLLHASVVSVKTTQDLLRHASPLITMGTYVKSVTADKRSAQEAITAMFTAGNQKQAHITVPMEANVPFGSLPL